MNTYNINMYKIEKFSFVIVMAHTDVIKFPNKINTRKINSITDNIPCDNLKFKLNFYILIILTYVGHKL